MKLARAANVAENTFRHCVGIPSVLRRSGLVILSAVVPAALAAQDAPRWEGFWSGNASWCARAGDVGDETPTWFGRDGFFGIEWSCEIESVSEIGVGQSWAISTTCLDAGFEYTQAQIFMVTHEDRLLIVDETGVTDNLVRCMVDPKDKE
ncbi:hypothetical protein [Shimia sp.]|uniref:hypothetical protein n=1 Tax=Shimia sp. TaxID=1954381 RepID=UPI0032996CD0